MYPASFPLVYSTCNIYIVLIQALKVSQSLTEAQSSAAQQLGIEVRVRIYLHVHGMLGWGDAQISKCWSAVHGVHFTHACLQLSQCVEEFESLVSLSMSLLEGQEPTPAMLFGPDGILTHIVYVYLAFSFIL